MEHASLNMELLLAAGSMIVALFKTFKFVHEGELGIKLRFGRALRDRQGKPRVIPPGFVLLIPFVETLKRHHVRQQTLRLSHQQVMIKRGLIFVVSAMVIFRVQDIYRALFEIDELDDSLSDLSQGILREVLARKEHTELTEMETISSELLTELQEKAREWGVTFIQFKLTDCAPTQETAPLVNAEAGVAMKLQALKAAVGGNGAAISSIPPGLAAVLVGVPLLTTVSVESDATHDDAASHAPKKEKQGFLEYLLGHEAEGVSEKRGS